MERISLHIDALTSGGAGIGRSPQGQAIFVPGTAPGDDVLVDITHDKGNFAHAKLQDVLKPGPARVVSSCPYAEQCGGCHWQHVAYTEQLFAKRSNMVAALQRIGGASAEDAQRCIAPVRASKRELAYRNKLELACTHDTQGRLVVGMHEHGSNTVITVDRCPLAHKAIADAPQAVQGALRFVEGTQDLGVFRIGLRHSVRTHALEIALWTTPGSFPRAMVAQTLQSALKPTSIVRVIADEGKARKIKNVEVLSGDGYWTEELGAHEFRISAPSFFQVNTNQAEVLQNLVLEGLQVQKGSTVADLYAGAGTFSLPLAERTKGCIAIESASSAVRDLRRNAKGAGVWIDVIGGDAARELPALGTLDALVVDPPRTGLAQGIIKSIAAAAPERLAYVSCNAATWARDAARLAACGYQLEQATPVDLFPQTYHVEIVSMFSRV